jgi:hypothetical protein
MPRRRRRSSCFAIEGAICVIMTIPLAGADGHARRGVRPRAGRRARRGGLLAGVAPRGTPLLTAFEAALPAPLPEPRGPHERDHRRPARGGLAERDRLHRDRAAPPGWLYAAGVAYPLRARIHGEGVGAVRHCEFTTGAFVEPITAWEPPQPARLRRRQPAAADARVEPLSPRPPAAPRRLFKARARRVPPGRPRRRPHPPRGQHLVHHRPRARARTGPCGRTS